MIVKKMSGLFVAIVSLTIFLTGCNLFNDAGRNSALPVDNIVPEGNANLVMEIRLPEGQSLSIRANGESNPTVSVALTLVNSGSETQPTWTIKKSFPVVDNKAEVSFASIPANPCLGEIAILNGSISGARNFHGAVDLVSGSNVMTLVPAGSGDIHDRTVEIARRLVSNGAIVKKTGATLVKQVSDLVKAADFSKPLAVENILNQLITTLNPDDSTFVTIDNNAKTFVGSRNSLTRWTTDNSVLTASDFAGQNLAANISPKGIFRMGPARHAYLYFEDDSTNNVGSIVKVKSDDGTRVAAATVHGKISHFFEIADDSVILAGFARSYNQSETLCPFVLNWNTSVDASFFQGSEQNTGFRWLKFYQQFKSVSGSNVFPEVLKLGSFSTDILIEILKQDGASRIAETFSAVSGPGTSLNEYAAINRLVRGLAVDPYLEGSQFYYDLNDNLAYDPGEPLSTLTDSNGEFTISGPISSAHDLLSRPDAPGKHLGRDFPFILRTNPDFQDNSGRVIASPITSVARYGSELAEIVATINAEFAKAGISETLSESDIRKDPLEGLDQISVDDITNGNLLKIRAVIAVQQYLAVVKKLENSNSSIFDYNFKIEDFKSADNLKIFQALAQIVKNACNVEFIRTSATTINSTIETVASSVNTNSNGFITLSEPQKSTIRNAIQIKAIDVAKTCASIAEYCSGKMVEAIATAAGDKNAINESFITELTTRTSSVMVPEVGPRYYFQRVEATLKNPPTVTGTTSPVDVDKMIWDGIKSGMKFDGAQSISGSIDLSFIDSNWQGFKGIEISGDGTNFTPIK